MYNIKPLINLYKTNIFIELNPTKNIKSTRAENVLDVISSRGGVPSQHSKQIRSDHLHLSSYNP
jgi:hypothetical protein